MGLMDYSLLLWEGIRFLTFLLVCGLLMEDRVPRRIAWAARAGFLAAELAVQVGVLLLGESYALMLSLLAATAYVPAIVYVHILSKNGFIQTCTVWMAGLLTALTLRCLYQVTVVAAGWLEEGPWRAVLLLGPPLPAAAALTVLAGFLRRPFQTCLREYSGGWLPLLFPTSVVFLLLSHIGSGTADPGTVALIFLATLSMLLVVSRLLLLSASIARTEEADRAAAQQLAIQRQDYEALQKKLELGRAYRHDMRHHLSTLDSLLQRGETDSARQYIGRLAGQITAVEGETWCGNPAVNAVLAAQISRARECGCAVEADVRIPDQLPFDEADLCVIFANALENAVHACQAIPGGGERRIRLSARLNDNRRLTIAVDNSCPIPVELDGEGMPTTPREKGHGYGLRNVQAVVRKYNGLLQCEWAEGEFRLHVVLFDSVERRSARRRRTVWPAVALTALFLVCFTANSLSKAVRVAQEMQAASVVDGAVWLLGAHSLSGSGKEEPGEDGTPDVPELEKLAWDSFLQYVSRTYGIYTDMDVGYTVVRDDADLLVVRFDGVVNRGSSGQFNRFLNYDKRRNRALSLSDLLKEGYVEAISQEVLRQMIDRQAKGEGDYYAPGGIWREDEWFQTIAPDQNFYINGDSQLVIAFNECQVAPGSMGAPEFIIPAQVLEDLLVQPSILD